jgi:DNA-binding PadR family transcriptional regulator
MVRGRHRKIYTLARQGRRALQDWVKSLPVKVISNAGDGFGSSRHPHDEGLHRFLGRRRKEPTGAVIKYKADRLPHAAMISAPGLRSRTAHELQGYSL